MPSKSKVTDRQRPASIEKNIRVPYEKKMKQLKSEKAPESIIRLEKTEFDKKMKKMKAERGYWIKG